MLNKFMFNKPSLTNKQWNIAESDNFSINILQRIMYQRKLNQDFINASITKLWPTHMAGLDNAIKVIYKHIIAKSNICIIGDYDVDGVCGTAILYSFLSNIANCYYKLPNRFKDGYGLTVELLKSLPLPNLVITVDNGTTAYEAIDYLEKHNIDLIIIDHHQLGKKITPAALLNPHVDGKETNLCATSLVFIFIAELNKFLHTKGFTKFDMLQYIDLVALATVCDVMSLTGLSRALVKLGLQRINNFPRIAVTSVLGAYMGKINTYHLGFILGPLINAAGRLADASLALELLLELDETKAKKLATQLTILNIQRKELEVGVYDELVDNNEKIFIHSNENLHEGVIGIIAGRIKDRFYKPTCIISLRGNVGKASMRAPENFHVGKFIEGLLENKIIPMGGGHAGAGGFTIERQNIELLSNFAKTYNWNNQQEILYIDEVIALSAISRCLDILQPLEPFGKCNKNPNFLIPNCEILHFYNIGEHSLLHISNNMINRESVMLFSTNKTQLSLLRKIGTRVHLVCQIYFNKLKSKASLQLIDAMLID